LVKLVWVGLTGCRYAEKVIGECEDAWKRLITGKVKRGDICLYVGPSACQPVIVWEQEKLTGSRDNTTLKDTPGNMDPDRVRLPPDEDLPPAPVEQDLEEWYYVDREAVDTQGTSLDGSDLHIGLDVRW
jgi:inorganic pyrophosphatase